MPYIKRSDKEPYDDHISALRDEMHACKKGELTYILYAIALGYIKNEGRSYTNISTAISCLIDSAEELRRRELNPYEDVKMLENGDVE